MKVFTCTDHAGHWVGVASVIIAKTEWAAKELLRDELKKQGLHQEGDITLQQIDADTACAYVLQNGDY